MTRRRIKPRRGFSPVVSGCKVSATCGFGSGLSGSPAREGLFQPCWALLPFDRLRRLHARGPGAICSIRRASAAAGIVSAVLGRRDALSPPGGSASLLRASRSMPRACRRAVRGGPRAGRRTLRSSRICAVPDRSGSISRSRTRSISTIWRQANCSGSASTVDVGERSRHRVEIRRARGRLCQNRRHDRESLSVESQDQQLGDCSGEDARPRSCIQRFFATKRP